MTHAATTDPATTGTSVTSVATDTPDETAAPSPAQQALAARMRVVSDFPAEGIEFEDLTPVLADAEAFRLLVRDIADVCRQHKPDLIGGLDARGFLLGSAVAYELGVGILAIRKKGKLPPPVHTVEYTLEYGTAALEIPADDTIPLSGQRVFLVDDVLATGGTLRASQELLERAGAEVCGLVTVLEISGLGGREKLAGVPLYVIAEGCGGSADPDDGRVDGEDVAETKTKGDLR